jgi:hypothetical protein
MGNNGCRSAFRLPGSIESFHNLAVIMAIYLQYVQLNALNLSAMGSGDITSARRPSICRPL